MHRTKLFFVMALAVLIGSCGPQKPADARTDQPVATDTTRVEPAVTTNDTSSSLEELVYEATGASTLKKETLARSQAEQKGRVAIMKVLAEDASQLIKAFAAVHGAHVLTPNADLEKYATEAAESLTKAATLRGSAVQEYSQSSKKDTTYATIEMPLMNGYEEIERVLVDVGQKNGYFSSADSFKKMFREFFMIEKKKMLTVPG